MIELEYIVLEDGLEYAIVDEIEINKEKFIYLVNEENNNVVVRKLNKDNKLVSIEDNEQIKDAMMHFAKKHRNDFA